MYTILVENFNKPSNGLKKHYLLQKNQVPKSISYIVTYSLAFFMVPMVSMKKALRYMTKLFLLPKN